MTVFSPDSKSSVEHTFVHIAHTKNMTLAFVQISANFPVREKHTNIVNTCSVQPKRQRGTCSDRHMSQHLGKQEHAGIVWEGDSHLTEISLFLSVCIFFFRLFYDSGVIYPSERERDRRTDVQRGRDSRGERNRERESVRERERVTNLALHFDLVKQI